MVPLVTHHRLLGFVAMMDEPHHHLKIKPTLPQLLGTKFTLYDKSALLDPVHLAGTNISYMKPKLTLDGLKSKYSKVYFIAHGFLETTEGPYQDLVRDLLEYKTDEEPAVVLVDWQNGAMSHMRDQQPTPKELLPEIYGQAVANTIVIGREVALLSYILIQSEVVSRGDVHYIGSGLGAQVMHFAGQWYAYLEDVVQQSSGGPRGVWKIGRITGLDPSARDFQGYGTEAKLPYLNYQDADFVDIIHTSSVRNDGDDDDVLNNRFGMSVQAGHADFYPNGGQVQPFCLQIPKCSHERSLLYFAASLTSDAKTIGFLFSQSANSHQEYLNVMRRNMLKKQFDLSASTQRFMGMEATFEFGERNDEQRQGYYSNFAVDPNGMPVLVDPRAPTELQLVDKLQPAILTNEGHDFSLFPSKPITKTLSLNPLERPGCGRFLLPPSAEGRVHFGLLPYVKQFPWTVCLAGIRENKDGSTQLITTCTGSIIQDDFVLTAAHCFKNYATNKQGYPQLRQDNRPMYVLFGIDCRRPILTRGVPVRQGVTVFIHPSYTLHGGISNFDIALIKLVSPVPAAMLPVNGQFSNTTALNTVCWRTSSQFDYGNTCEELYFAGYGLNDAVNATRSAALRWTVMKFSSALEKHKTSAIAVNTERRQRRNTCPGDSGGPLTQLIKATNGVDQQFGLVSPYTAIIVGTVIGGPPPCNGPFGSTIFCKVGHTEIMSWIDGILVRNLGPVASPLEMAPIDNDIDTYVRPFRSF
ncbi:Pancreatic lipase-related protein 2 [Halotydeus destructor]|nr:Pancreatic lipase-related protein 2 [Halotydeus destructor]